ncbi:hypothetical protein COOONC_22897 [Cooperia oncophora]
MFSGGAAQPTNRKKSKEPVKDDKLKKGESERKQREANKVPEQQSQPRQRGSEVVAKWVMRALNTGVDALRAEYRSLARYTLPDATYEAFKANHEAGRNRYVAPTSIAVERIFTLTFFGWIVVFIHYKN